VRTTTPPSSRLTRGYAVALASAAILSTTAIFIRYLTQSYQMPALVLAFWRDVLVCIALLPALLAFRPGLVRVRRLHLPYLAAYGVVLAAFNALWTLSVALNGAAAATVLVYSSAGFTALLGHWLLREDLGWAKLLAVGASLGGCALVAGALHPAAWRANVIGIVTGVLSGLAYAGYSLMGRAAAQRGLDPWTTALYTFAFAAVTLLAVNLLPGGAVPGGAARPADLFWLGDSATGWGVLVLLAAGPTLAGFGLYNVSLSLLPSSVANLVVSLEPAFTAALAFALFGERLGPGQLAGGAMILAAVVFIRVVEGRTERRLRLGSRVGLEAAGSE
jgi:drug/metabolite transporter (DMT)-like permease